MNEAETVDSMAGAAPPKGPARRALLAGMAALPAVALPAVAAPDPDAAVKALAAAVIEAERAYVAFGYDHHFFDSNDDNAREAEWNELGRRAYDLTGELADMPAVTLAGTVAKARALVVLMNGDGVRDLTDNGAALAGLVLRELAALDMRDGVA